MTYPPATPLSDDQIDDLLYFARIGDLQEFQSILTTSTTLPTTIFTQAIDPESGNTPLHFCAANGHAGVLDYILSLLPASHPMISHPNNEGNTPLHWAALNGQLEAVKALVLAGGDVGAKNQAGKSARFEAERAEKDEVVGFLLGKEEKAQGTEEGDDNNGSEVVGHDEDGKDEDIDGNDGVVKTA